MTNDRPMTIEVESNGGYQTAAVLGLFAVLVFGSLALVWHRHGGLALAAVAVLLFVGGLGAATFAAYAAYRVVSTKPLLVVDAEGIVDQASLGSVGRLTWSEIAGFSIRSVQNVPRLEVDVHDPAAVIRRQRSAVKRAILRFNHWRGHGFVGLVAGTVALPLDDLRRLLLEQRPPAA